jgi:single-strand DNA-binding protein
VANFLKKGSLAGVDGRIQTRNYEGQDGKRVYVTEVQAESVQFLDTKGSNSGGNTTQNTNNQQSNNGNTRVNEDPFAGSGQIDIADDDLPF